MSEAAEKPELLRLTAHIVQSYVGNNSVGKSELPALITSVFDTLSGTGAEPEPERLKPAVSIKRSIQPDFIVCLEDGKKLKMLKRHLSTAYGMTPEDYRERWNLPADYPMVAPNYAKRRSNLAKEIGLGQSNKRTKKAKPKTVAAKR